MSGPREYESHSSVGTYLRCPRAYENEYVHGRVGVERSRDLRMGIAWSEFLETGEVSSNADLSERDLALVEIMAHGYKQMYADVDEGMRREVALAADGIRAHLDGLHEGQGRVQESKFTRSRVDWKYWELRTHDRQSKLYLYLARKLVGKHIREVTYDVVRRPMQRPRRSENETRFLERVADEVYERRHEYYQRRTYTWPDDVLEHNFVNMKRIVGSMPVPGDYFPENQGSCGAFGEVCAYLPVCTGEAELSDDELYTIRKRRS